jgi:hypothetical protein
MEADQVVEVKVAYEQENRFTGSDNILYLIKTEPGIQDDERRVRFYQYARRIAGRSIIPPIRPKKRYPHFEPFDRPRRQDG